MSAMEAAIHRDLLTPEQVAEILTCSASGVRKMCQNGEIPGRKVGRRWYIPRPAFMRMMGLEEPSVDESGEEVTCR